MFARIFISFIVILTTAMVASSMAVSHFSTGTPLTWLIISVTILGSAAGLFYFILAETLGHSLPKQQPAHNGAKDLEQLKASLTASMSHELRTPLNSIIGFTGIILQGMSGDINERQRDQLERVAASAKRLLAMITDVINIAKIDSGSTEIHPATFFLAETVKEAVDELCRENHPYFNQVIIKVDISDEIQMYAERKKLLLCIRNALICIVECAGIRDIIVTAEKTKNDIRIIIGTSRPCLNQQELDDLVNYLQSPEPVAEDRISNKIRLHLTKKMVSELLGGSLSVNTEPDNSALLSLNFYPETERAKQINAVWISIY